MSGTSLKINLRPDPLNLVLKEHLSFRLFTKWDKPLMLDHAINLASLQIKSYNDYHRIKSAMGPANESSPGWLLVLDDVRPLLRFLQPCEHHLGPRNELLGVGEVGEQCLSGPHDALLHVGVRVAVTLHRPRLAPHDTVQVGSVLVFPALLRGVALRALLHEELLARLRVADRDVHTFERLLRSHNLQVVVVLCCVVMVTWRLYLNMENTGPHFRESMIHDRGVTRQLPGPWTTFMAAFLKTLEPETEKQVSQVSEIRIKEHWCTGGAGDCDRILGSEPAFAWRESGKPLWKNPPQFTRPGPNPDLPVLDSLFYYESSELDHVTNEVDI
uniref:(California timema) hypothetical protein n=1 Tax=Timema californicum TaxID=61474 RepID=A0A7R9JDV4_TIMCA|nr:unnamed protein product [Timema californicum]